MVEPKHLGIEEIVTFAVYFDDGSIQFFLTRTEADRLTLRAKREGITVQQLIQRIVRDSLGGDPPPFWK
jgi:hypothetical protein